MTKQLDQVEDTNKVKSVVSHVTCWSFMWPGS